MGLQKKNKGFTLIETVLVVAIIAIIAGIAISSSGDIRQKTEIEQTAGDIRNFFIEVGALASKTQQDIYVAIDTANHKLFAYYRENPTAAATTNYQATNVVKNIEGRVGTRGFFVDLDKMDWDGGNIYNTIRTVSGGDGQLFTRNTDGSLKMTTQHGRHVWYRFSSRVIANASFQHSTKFCFIKRGKYCAIIEIAGTGNMNMYISKKGSTTDFYPMK